MSEGNDAGTPPAEKGGNAPVEQGFIKLTQAEFDAKVKDRLDREHKKYADYPALKMKAEKFDELEKAQMSEVERLKTELAEKDKLLQEKDTVITGFALKEMKAAKLAEAGVAAEWIDSVSGSTEEEVAASVTKLAARLKVEPPKAAQGAGQTGIQNQVKNNTKIWTQSEIKELRLSGRLTDEVMAEIRQATAEGRVQ